jgi:hypothetical protein
LAWTKELLPVRDVVAKAAGLIFIADRVCSQETGYEDRQQSEAIRQRFY